MRAAIHGLELSQSLRPFNRIQCPQALGSIVKDFPAATFTIQLAKGRHLGFILGSQRQGGVIGFFYIHPIAFRIGPVGSYCSITPTQAFEHLRFLFPLEIDRFRGVVNGLQLPRAVTISSRTAIVSVRNSAAELVNP